MALNFKTIKKLTLPHKYWRQILLGGILIVSALYFTSTDRSFAISAQTKGIEIEFTNSISGAWRIPKAIYCMRREARTSGNSTNKWNEICNNRLYEVQQIPNFEISWPKGTKLRLSYFSETEQLEIFVTQEAENTINVNGKPLTKNSRIILQKSSWEKAGSFIFSGYATIGSVPSPGSFDYLISGRFEVWENLIFRSKPVLVNSGDFFPGDSVKIVGNNNYENTIVNGFISPTIDISAGLQVQIYSPSGPNLLKTERFSTDSSYTSSSWYDRAINDPWLIGVYAILALMLVIIQLYTETISLNTKKTKK